MINYLIISGNQDLLSCDNKCASLRTQENDLIISGKNTVDINNLWSWENKSNCTFYHGTTKQNICLPHDHLGLP